MLMSLLLRNFIRSFLVEASAKLPSKKLRVFDFDDTLVKTKSKIRVVSAKGDKFELTPGEYAVYEPMQGDVFDYGDFEKLIDPKEIKWTVDILRNIIKVGSEVVILTARADQKPVEEFLQQSNLPPIKVIALGSSDPQKKADYISKRIQDDGLTHVEFFDDSPKNVKAVIELRPKFPQTKIISRHIVHKDETSQY